MTGCDAWFPACHGHSHSNLPFSGDRPTSRVAVKVRICLTPASVTSMGDEYEARSSSAPHTRLPDWRSYATTDWPFAPPGSTTTVSSTTSGDADVPKSRLLAP